ncbi:MAG: transferase [Zunongwangia sp.]|uniref:Transferase n=1 Tax=Zunongwangia profunda TaxID=398743 RepID=A0A3D5IWS8_9FLAO|nr:transferase [Planctomycetota bacterium]MAO37978.1 transferase [Zunongwangia sp.]MAS72473.1 transferase [Zunongwangia sp.]HCV80291.1 transferase [Zunongwangia profunda]
MKVKILIELYSIKNSRIRRLIRSKIAKIEGGVMWSNSLRHLINKYHKIQIGYGSYGAMFSDVNSFKPGTIIGNYCSFANKISHFNANHPYDSFTMHPIVYSPLYGDVNNERLQRTKLIIGNDVWIGQNVVILPNVSHIGNGAVIGAGSIVTKNVEAYNIVAGNPARVIKKRFNSTVIKDLENIKWWEMDKEILMKKRKDLQQIVED